MGAGRGSPYAGPRRFCTADFNLGQRLFEDGPPPSRWDHPANAALVQRVRQFAVARGLTPREVNVAWLLNRLFPVVAIVSLPSLLDAEASQYVRGAQLRLDEDDLRTLRTA